MQYSRNTSKTQDVTQRCITAIVSVSLMWSMLIVWVMAIHLAETDGCTEGVASSSLLVPQLYRSFAEAIGRDKDATIKYLGTKDGALESACWFWNTNGLNKYCDNGDIKGATKRINGGYNGLSDREHHYHRAMSILDGSYKPQTAPVLLKVGSRGPEVTKVQGALNLDADGVFGLMTKTAVMDWQKRNDLTEDGIVGPKTYAALIGE